MIRSLRQVPSTKTAPATGRDERAHDDVRILREIVAALCERVEVLEAQALIIRPLLLGRAPI
jgi:hypothetical protein